MRLPAPDSAARMNCEQDFGDGGMNVTLTLRLLMHGKVKCLHMHAHAHMQDDICPPSQLILKEQTSSKRSVACYTHNQIMFTSDNLCAMMPLGYSPHDAETLMGFK